MLEEPGVALIGIPTSSTEGGFCYTELLRSPPLSVLVRSYVLPNSKRSHPAIFTEAVDITSLLQY